MEIDGQKSLGRDIALLLGGEENELCISYAADYIILQRCFFFFVSFFISFTLATVAAGKHQRQRESNSLVSERLVDGETPTFIYEIIQTRHTKSYSSISTA
jgi:hypothetical protein